MEKKYYTLAEANEMIPRLERMLLQIQEQRRELTRHYYQLQEKKRAYAQATPYLHEDAFFEEEAQLEFMQWNVGSLLNQIDALGVEVKDVDRGLCDFYSLYEGREVYLCWRMGEPYVSHWHELQSGYIGRKSIDPDTDVFENE